VGLADKWARHGSERESGGSIFETKNLKIEIEKRKGLF
jgi:hypothetical protein